MSKKNIKSEFDACDIFPLNLNKIPAEVKPNKIYEPSRIIELKSTQEKSINVNQNMKHVDKSFLEKSKTKTGPNILQPHQTGKSSAVNNMHLDFRVDLCGEKKLLKNFVVI